MALQQKLNSLHCAQQAHLIKTVEYQNNLPVTNLQRLTVEKVTSSEADLLLTLISQEGPVWFHFQVALTDPSQSFQHLIRVRQRLEHQPLISVLLIDEKDRQAYLELTSIDQPIYFLNKDLVLLL